VSARNLQAAEVSVCWHAWLCSVVVQRGLWLPEALESFAIAGCRRTHTQHLSPSDYGRFNSKKIYFLNKRTFL
jgi:hypothetical protein